MLNLKTKNLYISLILIGIGFIIILFLIINNDLKSRDYVNKIQKEYKIPEKKDYVAGRIIYIEPDHPNVKSAGVKLVILNTNQKVWLNDSYNIYSSTMYLQNLIEINDSIIKPANTDSLYLFKGTEKYFFVLNKYIFKKNE